MTRSRVMTDCHDVTWSFFEVFIWNSTTFVPNFWSHAENAQRHGNYRGRSGKEKKRRTRENKTSDRTLRRRETKGSGTRSNTSEKFPGTFYILVDVSMTFRMKIFQTIMFLWNFSGISRKLWVSNWHFRQDTMDRDIQDLDQMLKEVHHSPRSPKEDTNGEKEPNRIDTPTQNMLRERLEEDRRHRSEEEVFYFGIYFRVYLMIDERNDIKVYSRAVFVAIAFVLRLCRSKKNPPCGFAIK